MRAKPATVAPHAGKDLGAILKDCMLAGLLALAIFAPIVGLKTASAPGGLILEQHWLKVLVAAGIVFAGRLALHLLIWSRTDQAKAKARTGTASRIAARLEPLIPFIGVT